ncbi:MAG: L-threonylcarbamoyladenylate synthase [Turicibacter sp.]|nr:L-threonylcarbamoyladenylate synthase [Turicibacter sp.]
MKTLTIEEANELLAAGEVVAIPTETVYGLAADARSDAAVRKIFTAKGRPADNPLIVHIGDIGQVDELVTGVTDKARLLMTHFWPGPLTVILPSTNRVSNLVTAGLTTLGLRMPSHETASELLRTSGIPLAAPSANLSGKPSPTSAAHVRHDMTGRIAGVVDGGVCNVGLESTVIDMTSDMPVILRPGGVSQAQIEAVIGSVDVAEGSAEKPRSPGMKYTHYSPDAQVYLVDGSDLYFERMIDKYQHNGLKVGVLCGDLHIAKYPIGVVTKGIGNQGRHLYAALRAFDAQGVEVVLCEFFEDAAVMNRLLKASEERVLREVED